MYFAGQRYRKWQAEFNSQKVGRGLQFAGVCIRGEARQIVRRRAEGFDLQMLPRKATSWEAEVRFGTRHKEDQAGDKVKEQSEDEF